MAEYDDSQDEWGELETSHGSQRLAGHSYRHTHVGGQAHAHFGDSHVHQHITYTTAALQNGKQSFDYVRPIGLCLGQAPYMSNELFIGREADIDRMHGMFQRGIDNGEQQRLIVGGTAGIGKTQLAIAYCKRYSSVYDSIFWLNATSEATLKADVGMLAQQAFDSYVQETSTNEQTVIRVKQWLSNPKNNRWLLVLDNYDEPKSYSLQDYLPYTSHGAIIITSRRPDQVSGHKFRVQPIENISDSLQILQTRSQRSDVANDAHAQRLAKRLGGLPLALATVGAYLHNSSWTFEQYLTEYEKRWDTGCEQTHLPEYTDRSLSTTWDLSYERLRTDHPTAANLLKLLAYFDNKNIWHGLFCAKRQPYQHGKVSWLKRHFARKRHNVVENQTPDWLLATMRHADQFDQAMTTLVEYCFLEVQSTAHVYSIHPYVHDWTLGRLNHTVEAWCYWHAFDCVRGCLKPGDWVYLEYARYSDIVPHAKRLLHPSFDVVGMKMTKTRLEEARLIVELLLCQNQVSEAITLASRTLTQCEKVLGPEHENTLSYVHRLAMLYSDQDENTKAVKLFNRALTGWTKIKGPSHSSTLDVVHNLAILYSNQGKYVKAEEMYKRVLFESRKELEFEDPSTLLTVRTLGELYLEQGKHTEAEEMLKQALAGQEKVLESNHIEILATRSAIGDLYIRQGKLIKAEEICEKVLIASCKYLGEQHPFSAGANISLGDIYVAQSRLQEATQLFSQAATIYANQLTDSEIPPRNTLLGYAEALYKRMVTCGSPYLPIQNQFCGLIHLCGKSGKGDLLVMHWLARALIYLRDDENTQLALIYAYTDDDASRDILEVYCNACFLPITIDLGIHVCLRCVDFSLCNKCMSTYQEGRLNHSLCHGHEYINYGALIRQAKASPTRSASEFNAWVDSLMARYASH